MADVLYALDSMNQSKTWIKTDNSQVQSEKRGGVVQWQNGRFPSFL
jgi:hypothetical protein